MLHHRSRHVIAKTMLKMEIQIVLNGITMKNGFKFGACETCAIHNHDIGILLMSKIHVIAIAMPKMEIKMFSMAL